ncbi:tannase/feruloyl esterase family alpha/beta hydrolase [Rhodoferax ferrireducens]|uniref:tannase/feruloyl esterase family alpha/beta hydrolase n=1 Tax=Rhodoferax ferrireducens TaxID=192843 RepID=UPI0013003BE6|nr:tannase/feruloyl esterase family alpha/beta hydrolase [Rhodoferax ferrireducens]
MKVEFPDAKILTSSTIPAGNFTPVAGAATEANMPSFCRVSARVNPEVNVEVWLPVKDWNRRFLGTGNGGFAGSIQSYPVMADGLRRGFAVAATDAGHVGTLGDASWALGSNQRIVDFGDRALHQMTLKAKDVISKFYGTGPDRSYYNGCSTGGRQGLMEAQRYPGDYDGIVAGAPANHMVAQQIGHTGRAFALYENPSSAIPSAKIPLLAKTVLQQCDSIDGVTDGVLDDPRQCKLDLSSIACTTGDSSTCLTQPQITAITKIYAGTKNPRTGATLFPGYFPGGEEGTGGWAFTGSFGGPPATGTSWMRYAVFEDPNWDWRTFDFDSQADKAFAKLSSLVDATNPDLGAFQRRGGKLIQYHGWSDIYITPQVSVDYASAVKATMGSSTADSFYRLYMVPGMQHCQGGPGPNLFGGSSQGAPVKADPTNDVLSAVMAWVEQGQAPSHIVSSRRGSNGEVERTRKLCPFPQRAVYSGTGSTNAEASFVCH